MILKPVNIFDITKVMPAKAGTSCLGAQRFTKLR